MIICQTSTGKQDVLGSEQSPTIITAYVKRILQLFYYSHVLLSARPHHPTLIVLLIRKITADVIYLAIYFSYGSPNNVAKLQNQLVLS